MRLIQLSKLVLTMTDGDTYGNAEETSSPPCMEGLSLLILANHIQGTCHRVDITDYTTQ